MHRLFLAVFVLTVGFLSPVNAQPAATAQQAEEGVVVSTLAGVDLIALNRIDANNHNYGTDYLVHNRNEYAIKVTLKLVNRNNIRDTFPRKPLEVKAFERVSVGSVTQDVETEASSWNIDWEVSRY